MYHWIKLQQETDWLVRLCLQNRLWLTEKIRNTKVRDNNVNARKIKIRQSGISHAKFLVKRIVPELMIIDNTLKVNENETW